MVDAERIQQQLGGCGYYQILVYTLLSLVYMRGAWHTFGGMFLGATPDHTCIWEGNSTEVNDLTSSTTENLTAVNNLTSSAGECSMVTQTEMFCQLWNYSKTLYTSTIVSEWNLVCDQNYLVELSVTVYMIGTALGAVLLAPLSDRLGRKPIMLACLLIQTAFGVGVAFVNSYILFTLLRAVVGFLNMGIALSAYVSMTEVFPASHRTLPSIAVQLFWAGGVMFLSLFAYFVRDWRQLEILISLPNLLTLLYICLLPESLPWLLSKGKLKQAKKVLKFAVKLNKISESPTNLLDGHDTKEMVTHPDQYASVLNGKPRQEDEGPSEKGKPASEINGFLRVDKGQMSQEDHGKSGPGPLDLVRTPKIRLYAFVMWFLFFVNSLSYFGISFNTPNLHGNPFLNLFLMGAVEVPAYLMCMVITNWGGRRLPVCFFLLICGVSSIAAIFVPASLSSLKLTLVFIGKFGITGSYSTIYLLAAEIFPTAVRNQAVGIASFFENIGSISAPFIVFVAKKLPMLPLVMFGVLTIIGGGLVLLLPETRHRPLPETVEEVESWGKQARPVSTN